MRKFQTNMQIENFSIISNSFGNNIATGINSEKHPNSQPIFSWLSESYQNCEPTEGRNVFFAQKCTTRVVEMQLFLMPLRKFKKKHLMCARNVPKLSIKITVFNFSNTFNKQYMIKLYGSFNLLFQLNHLQISQNKQ